MTTTLELTTTFVPLTCCHKECGVEYAVTKQFYNYRRDDHEWFYCPNGHRQHFSGKSEVEEMQVKLDREQRWRREAEQREQEARAREHCAARRAAAARGQVTKIKNRIAKGVCPVPGCKRSGFTNVMNHIHTCHPNYVVPEED